MEEMHFERQYRTPSSEGYLIIRNDDRVGRLELHFTSSIVYGTILLEYEMEENYLLDLIEQIDDELVVTADVARDDFVVTVYHGKNLGTYSDDYFEEEEVNHN